MLTRFLVYFYSPDSGIQNLVSINRPKFPTIIRSNPAVHHADEPYALKFLDDK